MMNNNVFLKLSMQSHLLRILLLAFLTILLQIPISSIQSLIFEREQAEISAVTDVQGKWGLQQKITGPMLMLPYKLNYSDVDQNNALIQVAETRQLIVFPEVLDVNAQIQSDTRYRGVFQVPLYQSDVMLRGNFSKPDLSSLGIEEKNVLWAQAKLLVLVSDARAIQEQAVLKWNNESFKFVPGSDTITSNLPGYNVKLPGLDPALASYDFSISLKLNGSTAMFISPLGKDSSIKMQSDWIDPSFQGNLLPTKRSLDGGGFSAEWRIPYLGRNFPQLTKNFMEISDSVFKSQVGVELITPVDNYRMVERSIKYDVLFFVLTFVVIWLFEVLNGLRVHFVQYLFIGMALCIFYLLELSLSEHIGFYAAYAVATLAVVGLITSYSLVVVKTKKRAALIGAGLLAFYAYLLSLLQEQNYALLVGSLGLLLLLSIIMYVTRQLNWFELGQKSAGIINGQRPESLEENS